VAASVPVKTPSVAATSSSPSGLQDRRAVSARSMPLPSASVESVRDPRPGRRLRGAAPAPLVAIASVLAPEGGSVGSEASAAALLLMALLEAARKLSSGLVATVVGASGTGAALLVAAAAAAVLAGDGSSESAPAHKSDTTLECTWQAGVQSRGRLDKVTRWTGQASWRWAARGQGWCVVDVMTLQVMTLGSRHRPMTSLVTVLNTQCSLRKHGSQLHIILYFK
jgi:hypothetical protein